MRLFLLDNSSGYIFADSADLNGRVFSVTGPGIDGVKQDAIAFAKAFDASIGEHGRSYEFAPYTLSDEAGYFVYYTSEDLPVVTDGQDPEQIKDVQDRTAILGFIRITKEDAYA